VLISRFPLIACETVLGETPTALATSTMVAVRFAISVNFPYLIKSIINQNVLKQNSKKRIKSF